MVRTRLVVSDVMGTVDAPARIQEDECDLVIALEMVAESGRGREGKRDRCVSSPYRTRSLETLPVRVEVAPRTDSWETIRWTMPQMQMCHLSSLPGVFSTTTRIPVSEMRYPPLENTMRTSILFVKSSS